MIMPNRAAIAAVVDHTFLKTEHEGVPAQSQEDAIRALVAEAAAGGAFGVCIRPRWVKLARTLIDERSSPLRIVTVAGFPVGDSYSTDAIIAEIAQARVDGAHEFDIVAKIAALRSGRDMIYQRDLAAISLATGPSMLKIIFENCYLSAEEKVRAYRLAREALENAHADAPFPPRMFKTSTGFAQPRPGIAAGATLDDVALMSRHAGPSIGIKAAGGVTNFEEAVAFWKAAGMPIAQNEAKIPPEKFRIGASGLLKSLAAASPSSNHSY